MRNLAYGRYSDEDVAERLRDPTFKFRRRFEVLDRAFNIIGELSTVMSAKVEHNIDRDHKGALTLTMHPDEEIRDQLLSRLVRPYFGIEMQDGGWVEYPLGAYLWVHPERQLPQRSVEQWSLTLADQTWRLSLASPGPSGFLVRRGQRVTDVIRDIYQSLGYTDLNGITDSDETIAETKLWIYLTPATSEYGERKDVQQALDRVRTDLKNETDEAVMTELRSQESTLAARMLELNEIAPQTDETYVNWGQILAQLQSGIGYSAPYFDWTGEKPIAVPARNLSIEGADHHYLVSDRSIMGGLAISPDLSAIANRVIVKASNVDGLYGLAVADANTLYPNHPLAQRVVGDYIDITLEDSTAGTIEALQARAEKELGEALAKSHHNTAVTTDGPNPAHEPYDLVGIEWPGDADFNVENIFSQRGVTFDLDSPAMQLDLALVVR